MFVDIDGTLPAQYALADRIEGSHIQQLQVERYQGRMQVEEVKGRRERVIGYHILVPNRLPITLWDKAIAVEDDAVNLLRMKRGSVPAGPDEWALDDGSCDWYRPTPLSLAQEDTEISRERCRAVVSSWVGQFHYVEEEVLPDGSIRAGLRPPQSGAVHAVLAHWKVSDVPATVVMPTGTGKTETMLALTVACRIERLLVLVPSDTLRTQIAGKFLSFGWLRRFGVVGSGARYPVVAMLQEIPASTEALNNVLHRANVVVTTMSIATGGSEVVQRELVEWSTHVFIDEAHHVAAKTWSEFKSICAHKRVIQFTATPFRQDGKQVDGKVIFNYPLRKAQSEGYFKPVRFRPVAEYYPELADEAICDAAVETLESDLRNHLDHLVLARAETITDAKRLHELYLERAPQHNPVLIHSKMGQRAKQESLVALGERASRIIVCVDMLGEGFDLPSLKIAALHGVHKSLAITLQFTGRFTRSAPGIGDATVIANIADASVEERLRELYAEDSDWNTLLRNLSEGATDEEVRRSEFVEGFRAENPEISLQNVYPKMSAVVYRTSCENWSPQRIVDEIDERRLYAGPFINHEQRTLVVVTQEREPVQWGDIKDLRDVTWNLYAFHWNSEQNLLFINSSDNSSVHEELAYAVAGDASRLVRGETIFRPLYGINRFVILNLGLRHILSRSIQFSMHTGTDVGTALAEALRENKSKSNLFGKGYADGAVITLGCSQKGRVWAHRVASSLAEWVDWCQGIGARLIDEAIRTEEIFLNVVVPREITARPAVVPVAVEWDAEMVYRSETNVLLTADGVHYSIYEAELAISSFEAAGPLSFKLVLPTVGPVYEVRLREGGVDYVQTDGPAVTIAVGRKTVSLVDWFAEQSPVIYFADGSMLVANELSELPAGHRRVPFNVEKITPWNWGATNIQMESQRAERRAASIQRHVIDRILAEQVDPGHESIVFDDDGSGEIADIVALTASPNELCVRLFHLKYSSEPHTGGRVKDLYEVCGQVQRSIVWRHDVERMLERMKSRELRRRGTGGTRFERGDLGDLHRLKQRLPSLGVKFEIFAVQPGVSKAEVSVAQLELLAVTESYLRETIAVDFRLIASA